MLIFQGISPRRRLPSGRAVTIGNFDGVHLGHQALIDRTVTLAQQQGLKSALVTFEPHPRDFFAKLHNKPELAPARIATLRDKLLELESCGID
ncbi:MAG: bifunctional riboflavin kinase/FAD synthetase, partial [Oxalobacteraceae bacterium]|nr:bifunctional riboflavin kinase/FAD synthetase [Oxalobacteraceae bacterium]